MKIYKHLCDTKLFHYVSNSLVLIMSHQILLDLFLFEKIMQRITKDKHCRGVRWEVKSD